MVGAWVVVSEDNYTTALLEPDASGRVAVLVSDLEVNTYGWAQISGKAVALALADFADNGLVYATATPGSVDDEPVEGDRVKCALGASDRGTPAAGMAEFELGRPFVDDGATA